jgi:pimeloyl-ACP methyl ester carboxylesterase
MQNSCLDIKYIRLANSTIQYLEGGKGETILLLHGIPGSCYSWQKVGEMLSNSYHVIIPSLPGFGSSTEPNGDYYIKDQATAVHDLLVAMNISDIYLAAHDFGGPVAITMISTFSDINVRKLSVTATNLFTDTYIPVPLRTAKVPVLGSVIFWMMAGTNFGMNMMYRQAVRNKKYFTRNDFFKSVNKNCLKYTRKIFQRSLANLPGNYREVQAYLEKIAVPVLVLWGDKDPFFALDVAERTNRALKNSKLIVYKNTGHFVQEENADKTAVDIVNFISD